MATVWQGINYDGTPLAPLVEKLGYSTEEQNYSGLIARVINLIIPYLFVTAGIILFFYLLVGGFNLLTSFGDDSKISSAKKMITNAVIGFGIIFVSYWIILIIKVLLGIS